VSTAVFSSCGLYRYHLTRDCRTPLGGGSKAMAFVMLNPSTADATHDDPTVRRCRGFAEREGCVSFDIVNLYAYRTPSPRDLFDAAAAGIDPRGPENDRYLLDTIRRFGRDGNLLVAAWGAHALLSDVGWFAEKVNKERMHGPVEVWCLGRTKAGQPRHPLMLRSDSPLERWGARS
jgi:hypothetical protein